MLQQLKQFELDRQSKSHSIHSDSLVTTTFSVSKNFLFSTTLFQSHTNRRAWLYFLNIQFLSISRYTWILRLLSHRDTICVWSRRSVSCFFVVVCWCWHGPPQRTTRMPIKRTGRDLWIHNFSLWSSKQAQVGNERMWGFVDVMTSFENVKCEADKSRICILI